MTKAPKKRIRVVRAVDALSGGIREFIMPESYKLHERETAHFYTIEEPKNIIGVVKAQIGNTEIPMSFEWEEEKDQMEQKKEMTAKDAWIAMANGGFVKARAYIHKIDGSWIMFWNGSQWCAASNLDLGPYSIVPDPSKPVDSEYEKDWTDFYESARPQTELKALLEKHFVRKGES